MHTACEVAQLGDVEDAARLLAAYARALDDGFDPRR
jgi:putative aminopeptidase FrvX